MNRYNCKITQEDEEGIPSNICTLASQLSEIYPFNPIQLYSQLKRRGCPNPDCNLSSGKKLRAGSRIYSV